MKHKFGFTLAEVLITVGILGVIASFTMPTLINNYRNTARVTALRKFVVEFESALDLYMTEKGKTKIAQTGIYNDFDKFIQDKLSVTKTCNGSACMDSLYKSISGSSGKYTNDDCKSSYILSNSMIICANSGLVSVDINGTNPPNTGGRDVFTLLINPDTAKLIDWCNSGETCEDLCTKNIYGTGCFQLLKENNWKIKY